MQSNKTVTVNGKAYQVFSIPPTPALKNFLKLQKYILGPIGAAIDQAGAGSNIAEVLERNIDLGGALSKLAEAIEPDEMTALFKELIELGARDEKGNPLAFEVAFMGDIASIFGLVKEVVNHNYPDFFVMLSGLGGSKPKTDSTPAQ